MLFRGTQLKYLNLSLFFIGRTPFLQSNRWIGPYLRCDIRLQYENNSKNLKAIIDILLLAQLLFAGGNEGDLISFYKRRSEMQDVCSLQSIFLLKWNNRDSELRFKEPLAANRYNTAEIVHHSPNDSYKRA